MNIIYYMIIKKETKNSIIIYYVDKDYDDKKIEKIEYDNNHLLYSVPYHPETNSIEELFSQLKHYIKKESPNT